MRELQNVIERMMNYVHSNELTVDLMPADIIQRRRTSDFTDEFESPKDIEHQLLTKMLGMKLFKKETAIRMKVSRTML